MRRSKPKTPTTRRPARTVQLSVRLDSFSIEQLAAYNAQVLGGASTNAGVARLAIRVGLAALCAHHDAVRFHRLADRGEQR